MNYQTILETLNEKILCKDQHKRFFLLNLLQKITLFVT